MKGRERRLLVVAAFLAAAPVYADHGALSLDLGGGVAALSLPAPYASSGGNTFAVDFEAMLGLRYALTNEVEFTVAGFFEPSVSYTHDGVTVVTPTNGPFPGNVTHSLSAFGLLAGVRYVNGFVWKLVVGLEGGWCHRAYTGIQLFYPNGQPSNVPLQNFGTDNIVLQPLVGVEWAFADHWSASLLSRFTVLIGPDPTVGVSVMVSISYSWFL